jgi:hypothetical protein
MLTICVLSINASELVGWSPIVSAGEDVAVLLHDLITGHRAATSILVSFRLDLLSFDLLQQRCENSPRMLEFIGTDKVVLFAGEEIKEQAFVRIREAEVLKLVVSGYSINTYLESGIESQI